MMRRRPALTFLVPLEHWKIRHPEKTKIARGKATMGRRIFLCECDPQRASGRVHRAIMLLDLGLHATLRLVCGRAHAAGDNDEQIVRLGPASLAYLSHRVRKRLIQALDVFENLGPFTLALTHQRFDVVTLFA